MLTRGEYRPPDTPPSSDGAAIVDYLRRSNLALLAFIRGLNSKGALTINEAAELIANGPTGGIGYSTGAGGTVTQLTNKGTGVTLNKVCGLITMNNANLGAGASQGFVFTNSNIVAGDIVLVQLYDGYAGANTYEVKAETASGGAVQIFLKNTTAGILGEAVRIRFAVIKAVSA